MTIAFYAVDSVGIGHLSRTLGIAETIQLLDPKINIVFLSEANNSYLLDEYKFPYFQIPPFQALVADCRWEKIDSSIICWNELIKAILTTIRPHVMVYDTYIWLPVYNASMSIGAKQVLIMRKRKDIKDFLSSNKDLLRSFSLIAIPHNENELEKNIIDEIPSRYNFFGPLMRRTKSDLDLSIPVNKFGFRKKVFRITITNGGGNALLEKSDNYLEAVMTALKIIRKNIEPFQAIIVLGPLFKDFSAISKLNTKYITVRPYEPNMLEMFASSNLVISRGGYNTIMELSEIGVPSICIPANRITDDQGQRIKDFSNTHSNIHFSKLDSIEISKAIMSVHVQPRWSFVANSERDVCLENKKKLALEILSIMKS